MALFFNGRAYVTPTTVARVDDSAMYNPNPIVGNKLLVVGASEGGKPKELLRFRNAAEAQAMLVSGDGLDAIIAAFDPSSETGRPSEVDFIRVNPATQSSLTLKTSGGTDAILLQSTSYGKRQNQIKVKIEAGTRGVGSKISTQIGADVYSGDNIRSVPFKVIYQGAEVSATFSIGYTFCTLNAPAGTQLVQIPLIEFPTVQQLVDRINAVPGFVATVLNNLGGKPTLNAIDYYINWNVKDTNLNVSASLQAQIDWFNSNLEGLVSASKIGSAAGSRAANMDFTYLSGGSDGTTTNTDWSDAFTVAQTADVQWVVPASNNPAIHAMADAHCAYMSDVVQRHRRAFCGTPLGTSDDAAITLAEALNSDRTSLIHIGVYGYDRLGRLLLKEPFVAAAMVAGGFAGISPGSTMTNKSIKARGVERKLRNPTDTDKLIEGGILCIEDTQDGGFRVTKAITTWLKDTNFNRVEVSVGYANDFTARSLRDSIDELRGKKGGPLLITEALSRAETVLKELARPEPVGPGVLVGDAANPPYRNLDAQFQGDVIALQVQTSPVIPNNYGAITVFSVPFSSTASTA
jgi:hypothetical protein